MPNPLDLIIDSERLRLVPVAEEYAGPMWQEFTAEITTFMYPAPAEEINDSVSYIRESRERMAVGEEFSAAILLKATGEFLGGCGLHHIDGDTPELGIWIKRPAHGHAYGREAVTAMASWAFANLSVRYLIYPVDRLNIASRMIPESLGAIIEAEYQKTNASGRVLDLIEYRIYPPKQSKV
jgi:RimJ/RimL family protein N-acetyltransferase